MIHLPEQTNVIGLDRLFDLAAGLYLREPTHEMIAGVEAVLPAEFFPTGQAHLTASGEPAAQAALETVYQDYSDLFYAPVSGRYLAPYESAQREGCLGGRLTQQVDELYRACGFKPQSLPSNPHWQAPPLADHIGYELTFFSVLLGLVSFYKRQAGGQPSLWDQAVGEGLLQYFRNEHILTWMPDYGRKLEASAQTPLYRFLGRLTVALVSAV